MNKRTTIEANGSGQVLPIKALFGRLAENTLDPTFEKYGNFAYAPENDGGEALLPPGGMTFFGNFYDYSHVFNIWTTDAKLIKRLTAAIRANQAKPEYAQAKVEVAERERRDVARILERDRKRDEERAADARRTLGLETV